MKAVTEKSNTNSFGDIVNQLNKEDWKELLKQLPIDKIHNPKVFYKMAKQLSRLNKKTQLVKGFVINGEEVSLEQGLEQRITDIYRPKNTPCIQTRVARDFQ